MVDGMVKWVDYFVEADRGNNLFGCYDPWNMQTRMMTCQGAYMNQMNPQAKGRLVVHSNMGTFKMKQKLKTAIKWKMLRYR